MKILSFLFIFMPLFFSSGCGAGEKDHLDAVQNMHYLMWDFPKLCNFFKLTDEDEKNGYISFFVEPDKTLIQVMLANIKDEKEIDSVKKILIKIPKNRQIKNKIVLELYTKLNAKNAFVSTDKYKTIKIQ